MGILQGILGNFTEITKESAGEQYNEFLIQDEEIQFGYELVRDAIVITNFRILDFDKQGLTGKKMRCSTIYLDSITEIGVESAGALLDDSEINIVYICTPYYKSHSMKECRKKIEFPKKTNILPLYRFLSNIANDNRVRLNK